MFQKETKDKDVVTETDYPEGFCKEPFSTYEGHTGDVLDLSWSKVNIYFFEKYSFSQLSIFFFRTINILFQNYQFFFHTKLMNDLFKVIFVSLF